jgi:Fungal fucose-specific lectin
VTWFTLKGPYETLEEDMPFYTFAVPSFHITQVRSAHSDTLFASTALKVNNANGSLHLNFDPQGAALNDRKAGGGVDLPFTFKNVFVPPPTPENPDGGAVFWTFLLVNAGHTDSGFVAVLNKAADAFAGALAGDVIDSAGVDVVDSLEALAGLGIVLGAQEVLNLLTANCDGQVASGSFEFTAKQLAEMMQPGAIHPFTRANPGTSSPSGCGHENSQYDINYQIARNTEARIRELSLGNAGWLQAPLSDIVVNNPPAFQLETGSPLAALTGPDNVPRVFYAGVDDQIHELSLGNAGWTQAGISAIVTNDPPAFPMQSGSPLAALVSREGIPLIFYNGVDRHIHELRLERDGWIQADLSAIVVNNGPAFPAEIGTPLASIISLDGVIRIFYVGENNNIQQLSLEREGWTQGDITNLVTNSPPAHPRQSDSPLAAIVSPDGVPRVFYVGDDNSINELRLEKTGWIQASISTKVTNNPPAFPLKRGTAITAQVNNDSIPRVLYIGEDNQIHALRLERAGWVQEGISAIVTNRPPAFPPRENSPLATLATPDSIPRVFYIGADNQVHELRLERTSWVQDGISAIVTNNPPAFPPEINTPLFAYLSPNGVLRLVYRG